MTSLEEAYKAVQAENSQLRDYIIILQGRLIDTHGTFPDPPSNINLGTERHENDRTESTAPPTSDNGGMNPADVSQLQRAAAAASAAQHRESSEVSNGKLHHEEAAYMNHSPRPRSSEVRS